MPLSRADLTFSAVCLVGVVVTVTFVAIQANRSSSLHVSGFISLRGVPSAFLSLQFKSTRIVSESTLRFPGMMLCPPFVSRGNEPSGKQVVLCIVSVYCLDGCPSHTAWLSRATR